MYQNFRQLGRDSIIYMWGTVAGKIVAFIFIPLYTRVFSTEGYGVLDLINITGLIIISISTMGFYTALTMFYFQENDREDKKSVISTTFYLLLTTTVIMCAIGIIVSTPIAVLFLNNKSDAYFLRIAIITIPFTTILSFCSNLFRLIFKPIKYFYIILGNVILEACLIIFLIVFLKMGLAGALYGPLISSSVFSLIALYITRNNFNWKPSLKKMKLILKMSLPLAPTGIMMWVIDSSSRYFLAHFKTLSDIGLYSVGFKFAAILVFITTAFRLANAPFQLSVAKNKNVKDIYSKTLTYYLFFTLLIATALSLLGKDIMRIFTPHEYLNGYQVIAPLTMSFIVYGLYQILGIGLILAKKIRYITYAILGAALMSIILNILFIPQGGIFGASLATLCAYLAGLMLIYYWNQKYYYIKFELKKIFQVVLEALLFIAIGTSINPTSLVLSISVKFILVCIFAIIIYAHLDKEERKKFKKFFHEMYAIILLPITKHKSANQ